jgi:hypothetical protein
MGMEHTPNRHAADRLHDLRAEIRTLNAQADGLRVYRSMSENLSSESAGPKIFSCPQAAGPIPAGLHQCSLPSPC